MKIGIDARFYGSIGKGLGRYTQKLIENLEKISGNSEDQFFVFLRKENFDEYQPKNKNFQKVLADYQWYTISEQINMPRILNKYNLDLVHFPHFNIPLLYRKKFIITIHDLILLHFPTIKSTTLNSILYWIKFLTYKIVIRSAILRSKAIIAVSNFTKNDILNNYSVPDEKISVTYEAADLPPTTFLKNSNRNNDISTLKKVMGGEILEKYKITKPYVMYVGNAYPHKNLETLVLAYEDISDKNLKLVLVGKEDYFYQRLKGLAEKISAKGGPAYGGSNVIFTGFVPDEELDAVYKNSLFYIFPSLYEGFGLPPLEAMIRKIPVASSDITCMKEILGENAFYFNANKKENISRVINEFLNNKELREKLAENGLKWAKKYSWEEMAKKTLGIYHL